MNNEDVGKRKLKAVTFDEFDVPSYENWNEEAIAALKGGSFEKKY